MARLSCYTNCFGPAGVRRAVERARDCGLDRLELAMKPHDLGGLVIPAEAIVNEESDDRTVDHFCEHLLKHNVQIGGCNVGGFDLRTEEGYERTTRRIEFAARRFKPSVVVSGAGRPVGAAETAIVVSNLKRLGDRAAELGVTIALETHQGPTQNARAMLDLIAKIDRDRVGINFDTGNIFYYNQNVDVYSELEQVKTFVRNMHLKDCRGGYEDWYFPAIGEGGAIDFSRILSIMNAAGYDGIYTIEIEGISGEPEPGDAERERRVRQSVKHLHACGY